MKLTSINLFFIFLLIFTTALTGCYKFPKNDSSGNILKSKYDYPVKLCGQTIYNAPSKVMVISDSFIDIIHTLKYDDCLVGNPDEVLSNSQSIQNKYLLNMDKIVELCPDIILSTVEIDEDQKKTLSDMKINLLTLSNAHDIESFKSLYTNLGSIIKGANIGYSHALERAENILSTVESINFIIPDSDTLPKACYLYDIYGKCITGDDFSDIFFSCIKTENIAKNLLYGENIDMTNLYNIDPYYIFCAPGVKLQLQNDPTFSNLSAVKNNRVYEMPEYMMEYQGHTVIDAITYMTDCIYPNLMIDDSDYLSQNNTQNSISSENTDNLDQYDSQASQNETAYKELKLGDSGDDVYKMQARLKELGHMYVDPDGIFDEMTQQGVINFQFLSDLEATGIADIKTLSMLYSQDAVTGPDYQNN